LYIVSADHTVLKPFRGCNKYPMPAPGRASQSISIPEAHGREPTPANSACHCLYHVQGELLGCYPLDFGTPARCHTHACAQLPEAHSWSSRYPPSRSPIRRAPLHHRRHHITFSHPLTALRVISGRRKHQKVIPWHRTSAPSICSGLGATTWA
jgi:hypothetical protein